MEIGSNVDGACRLCLRGEGKISIFDNSSFMTVTAESIYNCVSVKITKDDKLPKGICESCVHSVENWCTFKITCDETQKKFEDFLLREKQSDEFFEDEGTICFQNGGIESNSGITYNVNTNDLKDSVIPSPRLLRHERDLDDAKSKEKDCPENNKDSITCSLVNGSNSVVVPNLLEDNVSVKLKDETLINDCHSLDKIHTSSDETIHTSNSGNPLNSHVYIVNSDSPVHNVNNAPSKENALNDICKYIDNKDFKSRTDSILVVENSGFNDSKDMDSLDLFIGKSQGPISLTAEESQSVGIDNNLGVKTFSDIPAVTSVNKCSTNTELHSENCPTPFSNSRNHDITEHGVISSTTNDLSEFQEKRIEIDMESECKEIQAQTNSFENEKIVSSEVLVDSIKENSTHCAATSREINKFDCSNNLTTSEFEVSKSLRESHSKMEIKIVSTTSLNSVDYDQQSSNHTSTVPSPVSNVNKITGITHNESGIYDCSNKTEIYSDTAEEPTSSSTEELQSQKQSNSQGGVGEISSQDVKTELMKEQVIFQERLQLNEPQVDVQQVVLEEESQITLNVGQSMLMTQEAEVDDARSFTPVSEVNEPSPSVASSDVQEPNSTSSDLQDVSHSAVLSNEQTSLLPQGLTTSIVSIKQEPLDPEPEEIPAQSFGIRIKTEFLFEEDLNHYESTSSRTDVNQYTPAINRGENTECDVCNRRYSTVNNYLKHLQTKVHLQNVAECQKPVQDQNDQPHDTSRDSPMLRSCLSGEPLNATADEASSSHSSLYFQGASTSSPRKKIAHCDLCNTSFSYVSEHRRHLLSKKHRHNMRFFSESQPPAKKVVISNNQNFSESKSVFICPIENCHFSCGTGANLLAHMKIHGIGDEVKTEDVGTCKPKLSARQQELLRKEAEKRRATEQQEMQRREQLKQKLHQQQIQQRRLQFLHKQKLQQEEQERVQLQYQQQQMQYQLQLEQDIEEIEFTEDYAPPSCERDYECEACHKTFLRESGLRKHSYYCQALKSSPNRNENKLPADNRETDSGTQKLHCPLCDISFASKNVFVSHVQIYHKGSNLENGLFKQNKKPSVSISNKSRVTNKKGLGFVCNICGRKFSLLSSLNFHIKTHTVSVKHICRICKEGFTSRKAFMEHCRLHFLKPGSKETLCHKCFKVFKTRSELYYHRKNDMCSIKMKIYSCSFCEHSFKDPSALEEHKIRYHSESMDLSENEHSPSIGELYDDSFLPMNPITLLDPPNDNFPGTSSGTNFHNKSIQSYNSVQSSKPSMNFSINNPEILDNKMNYVNNNPKTPMKTPFHCELCSTYYCSKQTLKKHIKKYHILNTSYIGSKRYSALKSSYQGNILKHWKCRHCKTSFKTRKMLVLHLKKCQYNDLENTKGMCLQCGKWCESGKSRICRFCLPDLSKLSKPQLKTSTEPNKFQQPDAVTLNAYKPIFKQEPGVNKYPDISNNELNSVYNTNNYFSNISSKKLLNYSMQRPQLKIKTECMDSPSTSSSESNSNVRNPQLHQNLGQKSNLNQANESSDLMKCPIGNKYFRNEMTMIKHYSQCDGSCENRCSRCRKLFNTPDEFKVHLVASTCFQSRQRYLNKISKLRYPSFGSKRKYTRQSVKLTEFNCSNIKPEPAPAIKDTNCLGENLDHTPVSLPDTTLDSSTYENSIFEESGITQESSTFLNPANTVIEEKSRKIGRICTLCDKVITMQRGVYRHVYGCFKVFMLTQDSVSCKKCLKTFSKHNSMKENTAAMRQHVLDCHFIPYYLGEGFSEDGSRIETPPPFLCYVCSFGFTYKRNLQMHVKEHRNNKDEVNNIVLQLEEALLDDERLVDEHTMFSLHIDLKNLDNKCTVRAGRTLTLQESPPEGTLSQSYTVRKVFQCDKCPRYFTNRNKYLRHKKVHGIVKKSVLNEVSKSMTDFIQGMECLSDEVFADEQVETVNNVNSLEN